MGVVDVGFLEALTGSRVPRASSRVVSSSRVAYLTFGLTVSIHNRTNTD